MPNRTEVLPFEGLEVSVIRSPRRTISIIVNEGKVTVRAPLLAGKGQLISLLEEKRSWILKHLQDAPRIVSLKWQDGEDAYYLGERYQLRLRSGKAHVEINGDEMIAYGNTLESQKKAYRRFMEDTLDQLIDRFHHELCYPVGDYTLKYRYYKARWGCCFKDRRLVILNICCGCLPEEGIRYVYCHELAHLKEANHQKAFYDQLYRIHPDYKRGLKITKGYRID